MIADEPRSWRYPGMEGVWRLDAELRPDFAPEQIAILAVRHEQGEDWQDAWVQKLIFAKPYEPAPTEFC